MICYRSNCTTLRAKYAVTTPQRTTERAWTEYSCGSHLARLVRLNDLRGDGVTVSFITEEKNP